jgi:4-aminobutyrate aminotransferase-like enzyme
VDPSDLAAASRRFVLHSLQRDHVIDRERKTAATAACAEAWGWAVDHGLLCQFGGIDGNVLKFKPPRTTPDDDFERMLDLVAGVTAFIQQTVHGRAGVAV